MPYGSAAKLYLELEFLSVRLTYVNEMLWQLIVWRLIENYGKNII